MPCKCGHQIRDHEWNFTEGKKEPCNICKCKDYGEEEVNTDG